MAKAKTAEDVKLAEIDAELERSRLRDQLIWRCFLATCITVVVISGFYFVTKALDKPPWLQVVLAILSTNGAQSLIIWRLWARLKGKVVSDEANELLRQSSPADPQGEDSP